MLRKLALAVATAGSLYSAPAMALGLGSIQLDSAQNEPLSAEIVLADIDGLALTDIQPELADNEDFQRAGIERFFFLSNLKFEPFVDSDGVSKIRVTTSQPVVEPYLSFLLEVNWPTGRLLKEYTVLLDPPSVAGKSALPEIRVATNNDAGTSQPVAPSQGGNITSTATITSRNETVTTTTERPVRNEQLPSGQYRVESGDTLWVIARDSRPQGASVNQTMVAIQRMNPNAFLNGNINLIKAGSVLDLPSADDVRRYAANQADQLVAEQNRAFSSGAPVAQEETLIATPTQPDEPVQAEQDADGRLEVVSESNPDDANKVEQLENELAISQDEVDRLSRQNELLNSRIADLEQSLQDMQRLIDLQSETAAVIAATATPTPNATGAVGEVMVDATPVAAETPTSNEAAPVAASPTPTLTPTPAPVAVVPEPEPNLLTKVTNWLTGNILNAAIVGLGAFIIVAGAIVLVTRRRKEDDLDDLEEEDLDALDGFDEEVDSLPEADHEAPEAAENSSEPDEENPFSNTEMYLAFGHFDQAMDELDAVEGRGVASHLVDEKRLEVLAEAGLRDRFEVIAHRVDLPAEKLQALQAKLSENEVALPDSSDDVDLSMDFNETADNDLSFDETSFDEGEELNLDSPESAAEAALDVDESNDLNFDAPEPIAEGMDLTEEQLDYSFDEPASEQDDGLDFDFDAPAPESQSSVDESPDSGDDFAADSGMDFDLPESDATPEAETPAAEAPSNEFDFDEVPAVEPVDSELPAAEESWEAPEFENVEEPEEQVKDAELDMGLDFGDLDADFDELSSELEASMNDPVQVSSDAPDSLDDDSDDDFGILSSADEFGTKLDLARAYIDMEDVESARDILQEVIADGDDEQKSQAQSLLSELN
ncbi:FimV/HubP family polar landmark protein [Salinibius halmophilus]|uniref:FimV/HubP family polar landmark protein n=1 Tax=Salinibius halmophilus TaxID=1853216 RepID=UPI000E665E56|nr:FimV/HubP family polar landmark protein [Salinibius halmophilus]